MTRAATLLKPRQGRSACTAPMGVGLAACRRDGTIVEACAVGRRWLSLLGGRPTGDLIVALTPLLPGIGPEMAALPVGAQATHRLTTAQGVALSLTVIAQSDTLLRLVFTSDQDRADAAAAAAEARLRYAALAGLDPDAIVIAVDACGRIAEWSAAAERGEGLPASRAEGMLLGDLFARAQLHLDVGALLEASSRDGRVQVSGLRLDEAGGLRWVRVTIAALRAPDGSLTGHLVRFDEPGHDTSREAELRRLAESDPLTGVLNRRAFDEAATAACALARGGGQAFAVVAFDLDRFKALNDRFGHAAGDAALRAMAEAARAGIRAGDLIGRLGGDEFAVALPRAGADLAERIARRLRRAIGGLSLPGRNLPPFTASFGVAASADSGEGFAETLARADAALYRAKAHGRDCVAVG